MEVARVAELTDVARVAVTDREPVHVDRAVRVRAAGVNVPRVTVEAVLPADVMGVFALIPGGI